MNFNQNKFDALVLYICNQCSECRDQLGKTKLNKVLWNSDKYYYAMTGKSITGETYIKRQFGPVSKRIESALQRLKESGKLHIGKMEFFGNEKYEYIPLVPPEQRLFSEDELDVVNAVIRRICFESTASQASEESHTQAWEIATIGEEIPLYTVFMEEPGELDEQDIEWAFEKLGLIGGAVANA